MTLRLALAVAACAGPALAEAQYASQVPGLEIVAADVLPPARKDTGEAEFCDHLFLPTPETAAGQAVRAKGWFVTKELPFGDQTAVSFVASATPATSGTCELADGNVGFFSGDALVALLYSSTDRGLMIGSIQSLSGGLRVFSGDLLPSPVADLIGADTEIVTVTPPAASEAVCNGAANLPYIYDLPIDQARAVLMRSGWQPVPASRENGGFSQAGDIANAGVPEVSDCSGTGFAFCLYSYSGPAGDLQVVTAGEIGEGGLLPAVSSYFVACR